MEELLLISSALADCCASFRWREGKRLMIVKMVLINLAPRRIRMSCSLLYSRIFWISFRWDSTSW